MLQKDQLKAKEYTIAKILTVGDVENKLLNKLLLTNF